MHKNGANQSRNPAFFPDLTVSHRFCSFFPVDIIHSCQFVYLQFLSVRCMYHWYVTHKLLSSASTVISQPITSGYTLLF